eukprot:7099010-Prymnesium_polylepis.1
MWPPWMSFPPVVCPHLLSTLSDLCGAAWHVWCVAAAERIEASTLEEVVVANTIPLPPNVMKDTRK